LAHLARFVVREALASARRAAPGAVVAGAVMNAEGAYAETSRLSADEAEAAIGPHAELCAEHGADVVIFEVVSTRSDLEAAARVGRRLARAGTPWALGLTTRADGATHAGVTMDEVARVVGSEPPIATFIQCTRFDLVTAALGPLVGALGGTSAVGVYANDGRRWIDRRWHGERVSELEYVQHAVRWRALGARVIGGCCGTSPDHVCALAILTGARRRASPGRARPR
jgi:S-methylmethionine-dependent homocysteine/selenocysteine methylase